MKFRSFILSLFLVFISSVFLFAQETFDVKKHYTKSEQMIPMRDGVKLFISVYTPKDQAQKYPIMLQRTPYSCMPYGEDKYKKSLGPSELMTKEGYIFVYEDVRGQFKSEGVFSMMRPFNSHKKTAEDIDENSDTYDTIDWLVKNIPNNNGRVGMWGISYPGYYTAKGVIDSHPALKAASPQAPIADMFIGDDFHHNGAFFLPHAFRFFSIFGRSKTGRTEAWRFMRSKIDNPDGYRFFLEMGPLKNANEKYLKYENPIWNDYMEHPNYDEYWQAQNILPHLKNVRCAVMTVGGWFDSEDNYAPLKVYSTIEKNNPGIANTIVIGPWFHGGWARANGDWLGNIYFREKTSRYYRKEVELPFFNYYLKDKGSLHNPEVLAFESGANHWNRFEQWPPVNVTTKNLYLHTGGKLSFTEPAATSGQVFDEYVSDPAKPVPFTAEITTSMGRTFMVEDQRFAYTRPDVLVYETGILNKPVTIAGAPVADLFVSTSGTDSDWIVKLIDVFPDTMSDYKERPNVRMGGFQMMVVGEVMRGKYRNSYEKPEPFVPGQVTEVKYELRDRHHTFLPGHKIMVQIQSTWFPLVDRNPQKFVNIYKADESDFQKATQRVYRNAQYSTHLELPVLVR